MKTLQGMMLAAVLCGASSAALSMPYGQDYFTIGDVSVEKVNELDFEAANFDEDCPDPFNPACDDVPPTGSGGNDPNGGGYDPTAGGYDPSGSGYDPNGPIGGPHSDSELGRARGVIALVGDIVALGEKIYTVIEKRKPVVKTVFSPIQVVPRNDVGGVVSPMEMERWSAPKTSKYKVTFKNLYGMKVVEIGISVTYLYGGTYNDSGKFIANLQILPTLVSAAWGYNVDATYKLVGIVNHGTKSNILAGATLNFNYKVSTIVKHFEKNMEFHVYGNGKMTKI